MNAPTETTRPCNSVMVADPSMGRVRPRPSFRTTFPCTAHPIACEVVGKLVSGQLDDEEFDRQLPPPLFFFFFNGISPWRAWYLAGAKVRAVVGGMVARDPPTARPATIERRMRRRAGGEMSSAQKKTLNSTLRLLATSQKHVFFFFYFGILSCLSVTREEDDRINQLIFEISSEMVVITSDDRPPVETVDGSRCSSGSHIPSLPQLTFPPPLLPIIPLHVSWLGMRPLGHHRPTSSGPLVAMGDLCKSMANSPRSANRGRWWL